MKISKSKNPARKKSPIKFHQRVDFDTEGDEQDVGKQISREVRAASTSGNDWTAEVIVTQLRRKNILLSPRFQRRDAWRVDRKSRFIESLIMGLPIPQIVLAESKDERGKFIVLDGKQRLLSILQFWGFAEGDFNRFKLNGLTMRKDLEGKTIEDIEQDFVLEDDFRSLCNAAIRTVVIKAWPDTDFLHTVFLRLNTGSVNLSPQELRQALLPGEFTDYIDDASCKSDGLRHLLGLDAPDARMRDIEIMARYLAFRHFVDNYAGRMKGFIDNSFREFNKHWKKYKPILNSDIEDFEAGVSALIDIFGDQVATKPSSPQFNRAVFDVLIYYHSQKEIREALDGKEKQVKAAFTDLFKDEGFRLAVESDTAGIPNTRTRFEAWGHSLNKIAGVDVKIPQLTDNE